MPQDEYPRPSLTTDVVLFRYHGGWLEILLIERRHAPFADTWALPGGFVDPGETPMAGAARELQEETGVEDIPLVDLAVFGTPGRDPRGWVVSAAFLGLAPPGCTARAGDDARAARWFRVGELPPLAFDHGDIITAARARLRELTQVGTAPLALLPASFRTQQARHLYSQIWDQPLRPGEFKAWLRRREAVERVGPARFRRLPALHPDWRR